MKVRASSTVILKTLLKMSCMSADDGSRSTIVMGFPSGQMRVCALKIFTSSALVRLVVEFAVSATIASCFAWAVPEATATHTNASSRHQSFIGVYSRSLEVTATDNRGNEVIFDFWRSASSSAVFYWIGGQRAVVPNSGPDFRIPSGWPTNRPELPVFPDKPVLALKP